MLLIFRHGAGRLSAVGIRVAVGHAGTGVVAVYPAACSRLRRHGRTDIRRRLRRDVGACAHDAVRRPSAGTQAGNKNERRERAYNEFSDFAPLLLKIFINIICRRSNIYVEINLISDIIKA